MRYLYSLLYCGECDAEQLAVALLGSFRKEGGVLSCRGGCVGASDWSWHWPPGVQRGPSLSRRSSPPMQQPRASKSPPSRPAWSNPIREMKGDRSIRSRPAGADIECLTLERIIYFAYGGVGSLKNPLLNDHPLDPTHVRGGPGWIRSDKFTINGKAEGNADRAVLMGPMLRARFLEGAVPAKDSPSDGRDCDVCHDGRESGLKIKPLQEGGCTGARAIRDLSQDAVAALAHGPTPICGSFNSTGGGVSANWVLGGRSLARSMQAAYSPM